MNNRFIEELRKKVDRIIYEREGEYTLAIVDMYGERLLICATNGETGYFYAKVALERDVTSISCREIMYSPIGLYVFSEDPIGLAEKSYSKSLALIRRAIR